MTGDVERAKDYRMCVERARKLARDVMPPEQKDSLMAIAKSYDRLAKQFEKRD